jgi:hypothetical protein
MSAPLRNTLLTRRGFLDRAIQSAKVAGATGVLTALGARKATGREDHNPWAYDVSRYLTTDPALIRYTEKASFTSPKSGARGLALGTDGHLWIASGNTILELSPDGTVLSEFSTAQEVRCLTFSGDRLYAAFKDQVVMFDRQGTQLALWDPAGGKAYFTGITAGANDVFVADAGQRIIHRYDKSGKALNRIGTRDKERSVPGFIVPSPFFSVALGSDGLLRATNPGRHRVELYTPAGDLELAWGKPGAAIENFCGCCNPIDLALLTDGRTVTFEKGIPRVKVYSATGEFESVVAGPEAFAENAKVCGPNDCTLGGMDGAADAEGRVLILDFVTGKVSVMQPKEDAA